jgi:transketolase
MLMRPFFAQLLHQEMQKNPNIWLVTGDLGFGLWDEIKTDFSDRFINTGAAEQAMLGVSVGLALEGKIPFVYSITPFLLYRPFETIRNYLHHEQIPVKLIGSGRSRDYHNEGFSHWAEEDGEIMKVLSGIESHWPSDNQELEKLFVRLVTEPKPFYVNLTKHL